VKTNCGGFPFKRGLFAIKSFYNVMVSNAGFRFPWKNVWRTKVHLRVVFFAWCSPNENPYYR